MNVAKEMLFAFAEEKKRELDLEVVYLVSGERGVRIARADKASILLVVLFLPNEVKWHCSFMHGFKHRQFSNERFPKPRSESGPSLRSMFSPSARNQH